MATKPKLNADDLRRAIKSKFSEPKFRTLFEVRSSNGFGNMRTADAIVLPGWQSAGWEIQGFEIKCSRSDLLKELASPEKAEEIKKYCHRWWLVVNDAKILKEGELPLGWGLMVPRGKALSIKVHAGQLEPEPITTPFLEMLMRGLEYTLREKHYDDENIQRRIDDAVATERRNDKWILQKAEANEKIIKEFNEKAGIPLTSYDLGVIVDVVKHAKASGIRNVRDAAMDEMNGSISRLKRAMESIEKAKEEMLKDE